MKLFSWFLKNTTPPAHPTYKQIKTDNSAMWPTAGVRKSTINSTVTFKPLKSTNLATSVIKLKPEQA